MTINDTQREHLVDYVKDKGRTDKDKIIFFFNFLQGKGLLGEFADYIGNGYGFKATPENMPLIEEMMNRRTA